MKKYILFLVIIFDTEIQQLIWPVGSLSTYCSILGSASKYTATYWLRRIACMRGFVRVLQDHCWIAVRFPWSSALYELPLNFCLYGFKSNLSLSSGFKLLVTLLCVIQNTMCSCICVQYINSRTWSLRLAVQLAVKCVGKFRMLSALLLTLLPCRRRQHVPLNLL